MKKRYVVFWMEKVRRIYGDHNYTVLGEWVSSFDTKLQAIEYLKTIPMKPTDTYTILEIYVSRD